jgi:hypothetical protein
MNHLMLNAFYDSVNELGPIVVWIFLLLMVIELIYVMVKYTGFFDKK